VIRLTHPKIEALTAKAVTRALKRVFIGIPPVEVDARIVPRSREDQ
jgi:hypothetical protein